MTYVKWLCSLWCNYECSYCRQEHSRAGGHWADFHSVEEWHNVYRRRFSGGLRLNVSGGEPMLDRRMVQLLHLFGDSEWVEGVSLDTNASWGGTDAIPKVSLQVSFHPEHVDIGKFLHQLDDKLNRGWHVDMVRLVALPERVPTLQEVAQELSKRSVPLSTLLAYGSSQYYDGPQLEKLKQFIPEEDWYNRSGGKVEGVMCSYPGVSYEVEPNGELYVSCHRNLNGDLFNGELPTAPSRVSCPHARCACEDMYFGADSEPVSSRNPAAEYSNRLSRRLSLTVLQ